MAARDLPIRIVAAVDWWDRACETYAVNHPSTLVVRADGRALPFVAGGYDLILGGIPCQWITHLRSIGMGNPVKTEELERERGLLDALLAFVSESRPRWWCLEDVVRLIRELPPLVPYQIVDAAQFGGQRRRRLYIGAFPKPRPNGRAGDVAGAFFRPGPWRVHPHTRRRTASLRNAWQKEETLYPVHADRKFPTVTTVGSRHDSKYAIIDPSVPGGRRQVEWQEAAGAQGFPADYVFVGNQTDASQMVANAVHVPTARAILEGIVREAGL